MSIIDAVTLNIVGVVTLVILAAFLLPYDDAGKLFGSLWLTIVLFTLSFWGWVIFVTVHFLDKYW